MLIGDALASLCDQAAAENPTSIAAHSLIGDVLSAKNDVEGALDAYWTAYRLYRKQEKGYEPPDHLINCITRLERSKRK